jgi:acylphosphatase
MERAVRVRVTGRVQGVFYRGWTRETALRLGLRGWVRNEPDGSVAALLAGPADAIDEMLTAMAAGPPHALVAALATEPAEPSEAAAGFAVLR